MTVQTFTARALLATLWLVACKPDTEPVRTTSAAGEQRSPSHDSAGSRGHSLIRLVNAVHNGRAVRAVIGQDPLFGDVGPEAVTDYREISTTLPNLSVGPLGQGTAATLSMKDRVFLEGSRYTVFLVAADMATNSLIVLRDDLKPDSGKARLRVLHAAPGAPPLRVLIDGQPDALIRSIAYGADAGFLDLPPGRVTLRFRPTDSNEALLRMSDIDLPRGTATTVVVTGSGSLSGFSFRDATLGPRPRA